MLSVTSTPAGITGWMFFVYQDGHLSETFHYHSTAATPASPLGLTIVTDSPSQPFPYQQVPPGSLAGSKPIPPGQTFSATYSGNTFTLSDCAAYLYWANPSNITRPFSCSFTYGGNQPPVTQTTTTTPTTEPTSTTSAVPFVVANPPARADINNNGNCPSQPPLSPGPDAATAATADARAAVPTVYTNINTSGYTIDSVTPASAGGYGQIAYGLCGNQVGVDTWVIQLTFPAEQPSASMSQGQLFASRFTYGWQIWYRYH